MSKADLSEYVRRLMKLKGLTHKDVKRASGGRITDGYVASISIGRARNPSVDKIIALAEGLGVDADDLFHVACGLPVPRDESRKSTPAAELLMIMETLQQAVVIPEVLEILNELTRLSPEERAKLLRFLKKMAAVKTKSRRKNGKT